MKRTLLISIISILLAMPTACLAGDEKLFDALDTNKDGSLTRDEVVKSDFTIVTRKDGTKQVQQRDPSKDAQASAMTPEEKQKLFDSIDLNKDNSISRKEWKRASPDGFVLWRY